MRQGWATRRILSHTRRVRGFYAYACVRARTRQKSRHRADGLLPAGRANFGRISVGAGSLTDCVTMASKEEILDKSFNKITNSHYECIHCGMHIKSSGILRRCAHLAGIKGFDSKPCKDPNGELQPVVVSAAKDVLDMHVKAKQRKAAAQLVRQAVRQDHNAQQSARKQSCSQLP